MQNGRCGNKMVNLRDFKGKKVFVTGHTGFKGSWLIAILHHLGAHVKGYGLEPLHSKDIFDAIEGNLICDSVIANVKDQKCLEAEILSFQPDFVFHLAAQPLVRESYSDPSETYAVNVLGTSYLLQSVLKLENPCTAIVITTDKVYENKETSIYYSENDILGGYDPYSTSKACAELVTTSFIRSFLSKDSIHCFATARAGNVIGGGDFSTDRIIPDLIRSIEQNTILEIRNPSAVRPWQHVLEPLIGYLKLALSKQNNYSLLPSYNFGPSEKDHLEVEELIKLAIEHSSKGKYIVKKTDQLHEANQLKLNIAAAKQDLDWYPCYSASEAIRLTMDWYFSQNKKETTYLQIKHYLNEIHQD